MLPVTALKDMRVLIATPCNSGAASNYFMSLWQLATDCVRIGLHAQLLVTAGSSITHLRNAQVASFLSDQQFTHLFFIDSDVGFKPSQFGRLLLADRDVVSGVYPFKVFSWPTDGLPSGMTLAEFEAKYFLYPYENLNDHIGVDAERFAEVKSAPTGFMCIKRNVFEKMQIHHPELQFEPKPLGKEYLPGTHWGFFDTLLHDRQSMTEDFAFCKRWRDTGGKIYIDVNSKLSHQGQHTWHGDLLAHMESLR